MNCVIVFFLSLHPLKEGAPKYFTDPTGLFLYPANKTTHFLFLDSKLITYSGLHILMAS